MVLRDNKIVLTGFFSQKHLIWVIVIAFVMIFSTAATSQTKVFKAGGALSNITPPLGVGIVGGWGAPLASNIHDELHARCLVLDDSDTKLVFIIVDNLYYGYLPTPEQHELGGL